MLETIVTYSIGEVAQKFDLSLPTIRYYDKENLIPNLRMKQGLEDLLKKI